MRRSSHGWVRCVYLVAQVGVACYPIYLFQLTNVYMGLNLPWFLSMLWALGIGFAVYQLVEKRFYKFPSYIDCVFSRTKHHNVVL